jgi:hypothetical protein
MGAEFARELEAVHHRHAQIAQDEIGAAVLDESLDPFLAVRRDGHASVEHREHVPSEVTMVSVILA